MKNIFYILLLLPTIIFAQYPSNSGQKITLGEQTTADGLVFRGVASIDTVTATSKITRANKQDTSAYILLDTVTNLLWHYKTGSNAWTQAGGSTLTNAVTGTGTTTYIPKFTGTSTIGNSNLINNASGNLGLGVTPSAWAAGLSVIQGTSSLSVGNSGNGGMNILANGYYGSNWTYVSSAQASWYQQIDGKHAWYSAPSGTAGNPISFTQAMTLDASGNLMVGTTSAAGKLHVYGSNPFARISNSVTGDGGIKISYGNSDTHGLHLTYNPGSALSYIDNTYPVSSFQIYGDIYFRQNVGGTMTTRMAIKADGGNVGIGTTSPTFKLDVLGNLRVSGTTSTVGTFSSSSSNCFISLIDSSNDNVFLGNDDGDFLIQTPTTSYSTKLIVKDDGNVGIGTTSPTARLQVKGSANAAEFALRVEDSGNNNLLSVQNNGAATFSSSVTANSLSLTTPLSVANGGTGSATKNFVDLTTEQSVNGVKTFLDTIIVNKGIRFPATQSASTNVNTLDDYEEGTFTPSWVSSGATFVYDAAYRHGRYTKIGNTVYVSFHISTTEIPGGTITNALTISGMPFVSGNVDNSHFSAFNYGYLYNIDWPANKTQATAIMNRNGSAVAMQWEQDSTASGQWLASALRAGSYLIINGFYFVP